MISLQKYAIIWWVSYDFFVIAYVTKFLSGLKVYAGAHAEIFEEEVGKCTESTIILGISESMPPPEKFC